jgi:hypothetical protein
VHHFREYCNCEVEYYHTKRAAKTHEEFRDQLYRLTDFLWKQYNNGLRMYVFRGTCVCVCVCVCVCLTDHMRLFRLRHGIP